MLSPIRKGNYKSSFDLSDERGINDACFYSPRMARDMTQRKRHGDRDDVIAKPTEAEEIFETG